MSSDDKEFTRRTPERCRGEGYVRGAGDNQATPARAQVLLRGQLFFFSRRVTKWPALNEDARRGGLGNSPLFPTGPPPLPPFFFQKKTNPYMYQNRTKKIPILTCIKIADSALELLLAPKPTLLDLRPFAASQVHIDFTLAAK